ncbi:putative chloroperoxidase [Mycena crocata]|nr:putative chloroperoxidase [Mycena crocata]
MPRLRKVIENIYIVIYDFFLAMFNLCTPNLKVGSVVPHGNPGAGGKWPEFVPPRKDDSRSPCPALNALANHGVLPHDGRNIKFTELTHVARTVYNFAPTFARFVPSLMADLLLKDYSTDTCDLADIKLHNGIEHDASLTRQDTAFDPDQDKPCIPFITELLECATGKAEDGTPMLTASDLSRYSGKRRSEARANNPDFTPLDLSHRLAASANTSGFLVIFGGKVTDLELFLKEERIPEGWESKMRSRMGLTFLDFNRTILKGERAIREEPSIPRKATPPPE